ncbi:MAG TPA: hypothetical protein VIJ12_02430 [Candidatus Baltobacteraceae bacterium]
MTANEMRATLGWKHARSLYRLAELAELGLITSYPCERAPSQRRRLNNGSTFAKELTPNRTKLWALDARHPWRWEIRAFARRLGKAMDLPGIGRTKKREYRGPTSAERPLKAIPPSSPPRAIFPVYGQSITSRVLMFLPHLGWYSNGISALDLALLLGTSRSPTALAIRYLEAWGIVQVAQTSQTLRIRLNTKYYAYESLKGLLLRIDRDTGAEFKALGRARGQVESRKMLRRYWAIKKRRTGKSSGRGIQATRCGSVDHRETARIT